MLQARRARVSFDLGTYLIRQNGIVLGYAPVVDGLFRLQVHEEMVTASLHAVTSLGTWHSRLGHLNHESVKQLARLSEGMELTGESEHGVCEACSLSLHPHRAIQLSKWRRTFRMARRQSPRQTKKKGFLQGFV